MKTDTRLSSMLHLLLHMAEAGEAITSEGLAGYLGTNPVVVRRTLAGLRQSGIVRSEKGRGGGWRLARPLAEITLADVHGALGSPALLAFGNRNDNPQCLVEQAVNERLSDTMDDVQAMVMSRLAAVTLADVDADFRRRMAASPHHSEGHHHA